MGKHADLALDLLAVIDADLAKTYRDGGVRARMYRGLREIVARHAGKHLCQDWCGSGTAPYAAGVPCPDVRSVARALGVAP